MDHAGKLTITRTTTWRSNLVASATGTQTCPIVIKAQEKVTTMQRSDVLHANTPPFRLFASPQSSLSVVNCQGTQQNNNKNDYFSRNDGSCDACLYTGVATCVGLTCYMWKMALLDLPEKGSMQFTKQVRNQKTFLLLFGGGWAAAGIYRIYLG